MMYLSPLAGRENVLRAYARSGQERYRFSASGIDADLIELNERFSLQYLFAACIIFFYQPHEMYGRTFCEGEGYVTTLTAFAMDIYDRSVRMTLLKQPRQRVN